MVTKSVKPVSITYRKTLEKYHQTILKSKLLYDNIEKLQGEQLAILSNKNVIDSNFKLIYFGEDDQLHTKDLNYSAASFTKYKWYWKGNFRYGSIFVLSPNHQDMKEETCGLLSSTGDEIVPPFYKGIEDIERSFLYCSSYKKAPHSPDVKEHDSIIDYNGRIWIDNVYRGAVASRLVKGFGSISMIFTLFGNNRDVGMIYLVRDGELYSAFRYPYRCGDERVSASMTDKGIEFSKVNKPVGFLKKTVKFSYKSIFEKAYKMNHGDKPKFIDVTMRQFRIEDR